jgi:hypothetical protein
VSFTRITMKRDSSSNINKSTHYERPRTLFGIASGRDPFACRFPRGDGRSSTAHRRWFLSIGSWGTRMFECIGPSVGRLLLLTDWLVRIERNKSWIGNWTVERPVLIRESLSHTVNCKNSLDSANIKKVSKGILFLITIDDDGIICTGDARKE